MSCRVATRGVGQSWGTERRRNEGDSVGTGDRTTVAWGDGDTGLLALGRVAEDKKGWLAFVGQELREVDVPQDHPK